MTTRVEVSPLQNLTPKIWTWPLEAGPERSNCEPPVGEPVEAAGFSAGATFVVLSAFAAVTTPLSTFARFPSG